MKRILALTLLMLMSLGGLHAQHYIGARGGYGAGYGRFYPRQDMNMAWGTFNGGVMWKYYSHEKYIGVGAELEFLRLAYEYKTAGEKNPDAYRRMINSVNLPITIQPHINLFKNRARVFFTLGVLVSYNFPVSQEYWYDETGLYKENKYNSVLIRDNPFGYGLCGGPGFNIAHGRWEFVVEARYYFQFGDILRNRNVYPGDPDKGISPNPLRSPLDNIHLTVGFYYRLTDKGLHLPPPPKNRRAGKRTITESNDLMVL